MFDIAFSELVIIALVALIVVGPERLPKVARTLGHLFGRLQRYVSQVKTDISREMELDELRKLKGSMEDAARGLERGFQQEVRSAEGEVRKLEQDLSAGAEPTPLGQERPAADEGAGARALDEKKA